MGRKKSLRNSGKFFLRTDREPNQFGEFPVYIQYTLDGKIAKGETGVWISEKDWDSGRQRVRSSHRLAFRLNRILDEKKLDIDTSVLECLGSSESRISIEMLRRIVHGEKTVSGTQEVDFIHFMRENQKQREKKGNISVSTFENGDNTIRKFQLFLLEKTGNDTIDCSKVTVRLITDYISWRQDVRGNKPETINKALTPIMKACRMAVVEGLMSSRIAETIAGLYLSHKRSLDDNNDDDNHSNHFLTEEKLRELVALYPLQRCQRSRDYMDMWFLSLHTCGLRFSDILTLQWSDIHWEDRKISKVIVKTKRLLEIPLSDNAILLLERLKERFGKKRFVFGLLPDKFNLADEQSVYFACKNKNAAVKTALKRIGKALDLPFNLGMHCARHTFAVLALTRGIDVKKLSVLLGHSSVLVTEKTYARYIPHVLEQEVKEKLLFDVLP